MKALTEYTVAPISFVADVFAATGRTLTPYQRAFLDTLGSGLLALRAKRPAASPRHWVEWTKGGKDSVLAAVVLWRLALVPWAFQGQVGAVDQAQADELRKAALEFIRAVPWLGRLVEPRATRLENPHTESVVEIIPADAPGSHGSRPDLLILNEICHHPSEEFASNMMDNAAKVGRNLTVVATTAGAVTHWSYKWRGVAVESDRWAVHLHQEPAPWITPTELAEAERRNPPSRFKRLYHGVWSSGSGDALSSEWIGRSIRLDGPTPGHPGPEWVCVAGLDAGTRRDFTALVVLAKHAGCYELVGPEPRRLTKLERVLEDIGELPPPVFHSREHYEAWAEHAEATRPNNRYKVIEPTNAIRLLHVRLWRPDGGEVDVSAVEREVVRCQKAYKLARVAFDPCQLAGPAQRLRRAGVRMQSVDPTGSNLSGMARELMGGFSDDRIELYPDEAPLRDLQSMSLVERSYGVRVESPHSREHGHADVGTAFCLALLAAGRVKTDRWRRDQEFVERVRAAVY